MSAPAFTEADVTKAVTGAQKAGFNVARIDIDRRSGRISLLASMGDMGAPAALSEADEIAEWLENDRSRSQGPASR